MEEQNESDKLVLNAIKPPMSVLKKPPTEQQRLTIRNILDKRKKESKVSPKSSKKTASPTKREDEYESFESFLQTPQHLIAPVVTSQPKVQKPPAPVKNTLNKNKMQVRNKAAKPLSDRSNSTASSKKYGFVPQISKLMEFPDLNQRDTKKRKFFEKLRAKTAEKARMLVGFSTTKYKERVKTECRAKNVVKHRKSFTPDIGIAFSNNGIALAQMKHMVITKTKTRYNHRLINTTRNSPTLLKGPAGKSVILKPLHDKEAIYDLRKSLALHKSRTNSPERRQPQRSTGSEISNGYYQYNYTTYANPEKAHNIAHFPICYLLAPKEVSAPPEEKVKVKPHSLTECRPSVASISKTLDVPIPKIEEESNPAKDRKERIESFMKARPYMRRLKVCNKNLDQLAKIHLKTNLDFLTPAFSERVEWLTLRGKRNFLL